MVLYWSVGYNSIELNRKVSKDYIQNMDFDMMPGFRFSWNYNKHLEQEAKYINDDRTKEFVRYR